MQILGKNDQTSDNWEIKLIVIPEIISVIPIII